MVTFAIGTDDFVIAGILPDIADDPAVSEAAAGQLVTVVSITYALAAPPLAVATARLPRKPMVVGGLSVFAAVNLVAAIAPSYAVLMALRVVAALIAAMVSPAVFGMAARLAAPDRDGRALGVVAGLTVSLFIGVPLGSLLADTFGWRSTFVAVVGVAGAVGTFVGGRLTDRWGADRTLVSAFASMAVAVVGLAVAGLSTVSPGGVSIRR